ncbi:MAG: hypothetical protein ACLQIB_09625 [Isosphaeraceae bacterium]
MNYEVQLTSQAEEDFSALPLHLQHYLERQLDDLAKSPVTLSRPSVTPPHPPGHMIYEVDYSLGQEHWHLSILFRYHQDEVHLIVTGIGRMGP